MTELERELGLSQRLLKQWGRAAKCDGAEAFPGHGRLQRENAILRQERDILKKAIAIFSQPAKPVTGS
jgi:transposase